MAGTGKCTPARGLSRYAAGRYHEAYQCFTPIETMSSKAASLPSSSEFQRLARKHTLIPLYRTLDADLETPVSAFLRLAAAEPECFLLESVEGGEKIGRYTYIGVRPYRRIVSRGRSISITEGEKTEEIEGDIFEVLKAALDGHSPAVLEGLPPFTAGAVGYFSYDVVRQIEKLPEFIERRKENFRYLHAALQPLEEYFGLPEATPGADPSWFGFPLGVREGAPFGREELIRALDAQMIGTRLLLGGNLVPQAA